MIKFSLLKEELDFNIVNTKYHVIHIKSLFILGNSDTIYRFISKKGNSYDCYFCLTNENNHILNNGSTLYSYSNGNLIITIFFL